MLQIIAFIILLVSILVIAFILFRKVPVLNELPKNGHHGIKKPELFMNAENKIKDFYFHFFEKQILLQKILSFTKIFILKTENKIDSLLHGVRKKTQEASKKGIERKKS